MICQGWLCKTVLVHAHSCRGQQECNDKRKPSTLTEQPRGQAHERAWTMAQPWGDSLTSSGWCVGTLLLVQSSQAICKDKTRKDGGYKHSQHTPPGGDADNNTKQTRAAISHCRLSDALFQHPDRISHVMHWLATQHRNETHDTSSTLLHSQHAHQTPPRKGFSLG